MRTNTHSSFGRSVRGTLLAVLGSTLAACNTDGNTDDVADEASDGDETSAGASTDTDGDTTGGDTTGGEPLQTCEADVDYPAGPYGFDKDQTIANFQFQGYNDGVAPLTDICLSDYYDPDGSRGIRALYLTRGHILCGACVQEAPNINGWQDKYAPHGATFLSVLWAGGQQAPDGSFPITEAALMGWIDEFSVAYDMAMDPELQLSGGVEPPTDPIGWLIDTRTMKIYHTYGGAPGFLQYMPDLLEENGATDVPP